MINKVKVEKKKAGRPKKVLSQVDKEVEDIFSEEYAEAQMVKDQRIKYGHALSDVQNNFLDDWDLMKNKPTLDQHNYLKNELDKLIRSNRPVLKIILSFRNGDPIRNKLIQLLYQREALEINPKWMLQLLPDVVCVPKDDQGFKIPKETLSVIIGDVETQAAGHYNKSLNAFEYDARNKDLDYNSGIGRLERMKKGLPIYHTVLFNKEKPTRVSLPNAIKIMMQYGHGVAFRSRNAMAGDSRDPWQLVEISKNYASEVAEAEELGRTLGRLS